MGGGSRAHRQHRRFGARCETGNRRHGGVANPRDAARCIEALEKIGYSHLAEHVLPDRLLFLVRSAGAEKSARTYHLHVAEAGGGFWERHLLFREYLRAHPETTREYARLKYKLAERFPGDVDAYTPAKTSFISAVVERARTPKP